MKADADPTRCEAFSLRRSQRYAQFAELVRQRSVASALLGDRHPEIAVLRQRASSISSSSPMTETDRSGSAQRFTRAVANENALAQTPKR